MLLPVVLFLVILLLFILLWRVWSQKHATPPITGQPRSSPSVPPAPGTIPNQFDPPTLAKTLALRLLGTPADGSRAAASASQTVGPVIWVDHGDEVLVHLEAMRIQMQDGLILVSVDLQTDQTGRTPLIISIALGKPNDSAGLLGVTDEYPRGNGILAARWGTVLQEAVWAALLSLAKDHAMQTGQAPRAIGVTTGKLSLQAGTPLEASSPS
jgi:hypothetical protein